MRAGEADLDAVKEDAFYQVLASSGVLQADQESARPGQRGRAQQQVESAPRFMPTSVSLFLTGACNLRCRYCYASGGDSPRTMPWPIARAALDLVADNLARDRRDSRQPKLTVHFHGGGEPTLARDMLRRVVAYASSKAADLGVRPFFTLGTNGVMSRDCATWVAEHMGEVTLSLDGPADIHDRQRPLATGGPSFEKALQTAQLWDSMGFRYGIRTTVTAESVDHLPAITEALFRLTSASRIKLEPLFVHGRADSLNLAPPSAERFVPAFLEAVEVGRRAGREVVFSAFRPHTVSARFCGAGRSFCVTPEGWVTSCYEVASPEDPRAARFLYGRWDECKGRFRLDHQTREEQASRDSCAETPCRDCFCRWHCAGDCPAKRTWAAGGSQPDPDRCAIVRALQATWLVNELDRLNSSLPPEQPPECR